MSTRADVIYLCFRCFKFHAAATVADGHAAVETLLSTGRLPVDAHREHDILARMPHRCDDGRIGVAELIGADPTPIEPSTDQAGSEADGPEPFHPDHQTARA